MESSHFNMSSRIIHTQCSSRVLENASAPKRQKRNPVPRRPFISKVLEDLVPFLNPPYLAGTFKGPRGGERGGVAFRGNGANENFNKPNGRDRRLSRDFSRVPPTFFLFPLGLQSPTTDFQYPIPFINGKC